MAANAVVSLVSVFLGGGLAILGGVISPVVVEAAKEKRLRRSLSLALQGEVQALLEIIEQRGYVQGLKDSKATTERTGMTVPFHFRVRRQYFRVFEANVGAIGILEQPLAGLVAKFYTFGNGLLEDVERLEEMAGRAADPIEAVAAYGGAIRVFEEVIRLGGEIVGEVDRLYGRP